MHTHSSAGTPLSILTFLGIHFAVYLQLRGYTLMYTHSSAGTPLSILTVLGAHFTVYLQLREYTLMYTHSSIGRPTCSHSVFYTTELVRILEKKFLPVHQSSTGRIKTLWEKGNSINANVRIQIIIKASVRPKHRRIRRSHNSERLSSDRL